jgi:CHAD domain-containing protein
VVAEAMGGELTTNAWREIEVELVEGDDGLLAEARAALIAAGAHPSDSSSKLRRALGHRLDALDLPDLAGPAAAARLARTNRSTSRPGGRKVKGSKGKSRKDDVVPSAGEVVVQYLTLNLTALIAEDPRVRVSEDEGVHQMRVASRRLRTTLATFRPLFVGRPGDPLREELKWLAGLLGVARDAEVMRARLHLELDRQPAELVIGPVRRRIDLELGRALQDGHRDVVEALDGERYLALITALESFVADPPFSEHGLAPAPSELRKRVAKACARVSVAADGLRGLGDPADLDHHLHEVRIAAKRARYAAEAVRPVVGRRAKRVASAMEQIQETLGNHQDAVVERQWLRDLAIRAFLDGENAFTFGRLHALTEFGAGHDRERFAAVWTQTRKTLTAWPA